jgi:hypothetical protein
LTSFNNLQIEEREQKAKRRLEKKEEGINKGKKETTMPPSHQKVIPVALEIRLDD